MLMHEDDFKARMHRLVERCEYQSMIADDMKRHA